MVRNYKKKPGTRRLQYTQDAVATALIELEEGFTDREVSDKYNIPRRTLQNRFKGKVKNPGQFGRNIALLAEELASPCPECSSIKGLRVRLRFGHVATLCLLSLDKDASIYPSVQNQHARR